MDYCHFFQKSFMKIYIKILSLQRENKKNRNRDVAQLVARHVRDVEVGRSSRLIPTPKRSIQYCF